MKNFILFAGVFLSFLFAHAESREFLPGATQQEREIRWVWKYLRDVALSCAQSKIECQDPEIQKVLSDLNNYLPFYETAPAKTWNDLLHFVSEKERPDLFKTDQGEVHRLAVTALQKNSPIYINTDRMHLELADWAGILAHEAVHHLGLPDDSTRLPDRVATEVATHFRRRIQMVNLEQFNLPKARSLVFNSQAPQRLTIGFVSWDEMAFDVEWGPTQLVPICQAGETVNRQFVGLSAYRVNRVRSKAGVVTVRGGGFVNIECMNSTGFKYVYRLLIGAGLDLQYPTPFDLSKIESQTPKVISRNGLMGPSNNPADAVGSPNQSFWIQSTTNEKDVLTAGDTWRSKIIVTSSDGYQPKVCEIYFTASKWSYWAQNLMSAPAIFDNCSLKPLGNNRYEVSGEFTFPADMQPDDFYVTMIIFKDPVGDRLAMPSKPKLVKVQNPQGSPQAHIDAFSTIGLQPLSKYKNENLKGSYKAALGQTFTVQVQVKGPQNIADVQVDMELWAPRGDGYQMIWYNGPVGDMSEIFQGVKITPNAEGHLVTLTVKMPATVVGIPIMAMRFARIYMRTSDFSWVEYEMPDPMESVVINEKFL